MPAADLHDRVLAEIGHSIVAGEWRPGDVLRMEQLEATHGVSRSVMREVVRVLVAMNLVESRRSVGLTVRDSVFWNQFDPQIIRWRLAGPDHVIQLQFLGELREGIEPVAAELAARRALPEHCGELVRAVVAMTVASKAGDMTSLTQADIDFHRSLLVASGNPMFAGLGEVMGEVIRGRVGHHLAPDRPNVATIDLHVAVAMAVQAGDVVGARSGLDAILDEARHGMLSAASKAAAPMGVEPQAPA